MLVQSVHYFLRKLLKHWTTVPLNHSSSSPNLPSPLSNSETYPNQETSINFNLKILVRRFTGTAFSKSFLEQTSRRTFENPVPLNRRTTLPTSHLFPFFFTFSMRKWSYILKIEYRNSLQSRLAQGILDRLPPEHQSFLWAPREWWSFSISYLTIMYLCL